MSEAKHKNLSWKVGKEITDKKIITAILTTNAFQYPLWRDDERLGVNEKLMLAMLWNEFNFRRWCSQLLITDSQMSQMLGVSKGSAAVKKAREKLRDLGYIKFVTSKGDGRERGGTRYSLVALEEFTPSDMILSSSGGKVAVNPVNKFVGYSVRTAAEALQGFPVDDMEAEKLALLEREFTTQPVLRVIDYLGRKGDEVFSADDDVAWLVRLYLEGELCDSDEKFILDSERKGLSEEIKIAWIETGSRYDSDLLFKLLRFQRLYGSELIVRCINEARAESNVKSSRFGLDMVEAYMKRLKESEGLNNEVVVAVLNSRQDLPIYAKERLALWKLQRKYTAEKVIRAVEAVMSLGELVNADSLKNYLARE